LETYREQRCVLALYEAPHRIAEMLRDAADVLGERPTVVAREVTKLHEEFARGTLSELAARFSQREPKGEMTVLIGPPTQNSNAGVAATRLPLTARVNEIMKEFGVDHKTALKRAARERGLTKREAYKELLMSQRN
jgi:16S rRNA (cytidine1402-2'-O)-methyltransferase